MCTCLKKLCVVLLLSVGFVSTEVTVENGGYSVSVSFSQNVPYEDGLSILENLKLSIQDASEILHNAIGLQFSKVTFKIPFSWDTLKWNITTENSIEHSKSKTDFLVDNAKDVVFGKFPFAQQFGSCGISGYQIVIPTAFFDEANAFPKGVTLAREWLKYHYGVFDENGYFADTLYPLYYTVPGMDPNEVQITDCINAQVTYNILDQSGNNCSALGKTITDRLNYKECKIKLDKENLENVTSSIMYFHEDIPTMQHICGKDPDHQHNSRSPNKQNALCYGQSIWDVVKKSSDFQNDITAKEYVDIEYVYVQESKPKIVVAWEDTVPVKTKGSLILKAIQKLMIDLPHGSKFNAFPFKDRVSDNRNYTLHELNGREDKRRILSDITSDFVQGENANVNAALVKAVDILRSSVANVSQLQGSTILIITRSSASEVDDSLPGALKEIKACVKILYFSQNTVPEEMKTYVSALPCASIEEISMADKDEDTYNELFKTMEMVLPATEDDKLTETVKTEYLNETSTISIQVDDTIETVTFWTFTRKDSSNFVLKLNEEKKENAIKEEVFGNVVALSYSPPKAGNIKFEYPYPTEPILTQVRTTSKAGMYFNAIVFVHDPTEKGSSVQMPVIIYAIIRFGAYPVQNAKVSAMIERPNGNNIELELNDDGKGDPDITQNDGIFSRYFTGFTEKGEYTITITVKNKGYLTTYGVDKNAGYQSCCGSYVKTDTSKLSEFLKVFKTAFTARSGRPEDGYKPSRVADLRIAKVTDDKIILKWSAPGEEADSGTASRYEIKLFCGAENITDCTDIHSMVRILNKPPPLNYGREQEVTIQILDRTQKILVGIVALNEKNKMSDLSNTVEIFRSSEITMVVTTTDPTTAIVQASQVGMIIGCVIVGIIISICIAITIIYYLKQKSQYKKPEVHEIEENVNKDNHEVKTTFKATDHCIKSAPVKKIESFPVLLYTHDQIKDFKDKEKDPPLCKGDIPPKPWASLDVISNLRKEADRDTKSLGSSSTINPTDESEMNEIKYNNVS